MAEYTKEFKLIAEYICDEYERRKSDRTDLEKEWDEIDRQIKMIPTDGHKRTRGALDKNKAWMPEVELPLQAQTLEVLTADARRMEFPDSGLWFRANAEMTDDYLDKHDLTSIISGQKNDVPSHIDQDNINKLVEGTMAHWFRQYDFRGNVDQINAESFKYSVGIGRGRMVKKRVFQNTAKGVVREDTLVPVLFPMPLRSTYLDTSKSFLLNEGEMMGPLTIFKKSQKLADLQKAASLGSNDPRNENGGWRPSALKGLEGDKSGEIDIIEAEGDIIIPKGRSGSIVIPNAIVSVVKGYRGGSPSTAIIRFRIRSKPLSTFIEFPYHKESIESAYGSSPLLKGWPIQMAASEALLRVIMAGQLNTQPPIFYDRDDAVLAQSGGPKLYPGAMNPTMGDVKEIKVGDPGALFQIYLGFLQQYADVTGVNAPRLGAQTVSHTTAYAKEAELNRGVVRTVDFIKSSLQGPLTQWLYNCYEMGRDNFSKTTLFIDSYGGFVTIDKSHLPKNVMFEAYGAGGPQEEQVRIQNKLNSIQQAMALEQFKALELQGIKPTVNIEEAQKELLRDGGWKDIDIITNTDRVDPGSEIQSGLPVDPGGAPVAPGAALQALENA